MEVRTQYKSQKKHTALLYKIIFLISEGTLWKRKEASHISLDTERHSFLSLTKVTVCAVMVNTHQNISPPFHLLMQKAAIKKIPYLNSGMSPSTRPTSSPAMIPEALPPKSYTPTAQSTKAQPTCWSYIAGKAVLRKKVLCPRAQATPRLTQAGNRMQTCGEWSTKDKRAEGFARISGRWSA